MSVNLEPFIAKATERREQVEQEMADFDFSAGDQQSFARISREYQRLTQLLELWKDYAETVRQLTDNRELLESEDDAEFLEVVQRDIESLEQQTERLDCQLKALIVPPDENEDRNIILEIRPAAGGDEASLFAGDLLRMYTRFAEQKGWRQEVLELAESDLGGIKAVTAALQGEAVYRLLRFESGVHRVQRIPVTESGGRIHTSTVTVAVLPEAEEVDVQINTEDLRFDVFRSSGPGGQHVNTTDSAVRVTHLPTGFSVASQQEKSQHRNKEIALRILRARLLEIRQSEEDAKNAAQRRQQVGTGDRSERIRTYNFPQNRVTDHRFGITLYDLAGVIDGNLDDLFTQILALAAEQRLADALQDDVLPQSSSGPDSWAG